MQDQSRQTAGGDRIRSFFLQWSLLASVFTSSRHVLLQDLTLFLQGMHLCFRAPDRAAVRAFHATALAAGGQDNGGPGLRPQYHPDYYAAFVLDPDGHRIEAVCHAPETPAVV
jgi:catechol 2,3-dioxygenase-like lactoylglutathione lyase family enzyme